MKTLTYKIQFIDSVRFMSSSLSRLADNLSKGLHNGRCKDCKSDLYYVRVEHRKLTFKCIGCNENYEKESSTMETSTNFVLCRGKVFIHTNA